MTLPKFTPGPWKVERHNGKIEVWNQNTFICSLDSIRFGAVHPPCQDELNARLIAEAPALYEFVLGFVNKIKRGETLNAADTFVLSAIRTLMKITPDAGGD